MHEFCKHFAEVDTGVSISTKGLLKLTQSEINEIWAARNYGLHAEYLQDNYVYLVDNNGKDASFKGFQKNINANVTAPYKVCTAHTQASWEAYQAQQEAKPPVTPEGGGTTTPDTRTQTTTPAA